MKKIIQTNKAPQAIGPYSQAIEINGSLFVSGQIPVDPATGNVVKEDIIEQTHQVLKNLSSILSAAGYSMSDVVKTTCMLSDMANFAAMNSVYAEYFTSEYPARSTFQVVALPKGVLVEIDAIAMKG
ncbi:MAG TPA: RidA family protein [Bacteroidales bacterium]|nr:RidA family protein [Bacteroidales bacterium]